MQAVLILAHKDVASVVRVSEMLSSRFLVYIHFDKKLWLTQQDRELLKLKHVKYIQEVDVNSASLIQRLEEYREE